MFSTFMGLSDGGWPNAVALDPSEQCFHQRRDLDRSQFQHADLRAVSDAALSSSWITHGSERWNFRIISRSRLCYGIAIDSAGNAHIVGTRGGPLLINLDAGGNPTFVMLTLNGNPTRIAIGQSRQYLPRAESPPIRRWRLRLDAYQSTYGGGGDAFVSVLDPSRHLQSLHHLPGRKRIWISRKGSRSTPRRTCI